MPASCWLLFGLFFDPEDEGRTFLRNFSEIFPDYAVRVTNLILNSWSIIYILSSINLHFSNRFCCKNIKFIGALKLHGSNWTYRQNDVNPLSEKIAFARHRRTWNHQNVSDVRGVIISRCCVSLSCWPKRVWPPPVSSKVLAKTWNLY
jgi:hypothetical protein